MLNNGLNIHLGAQLYSFDPDYTGLLPNNSVIVTDNFGQMPRLQCISGSKSPQVGQWIAPSGQDATFRINDPFDLILGNVNDPGYLEISLHSGRFITFNDQGVYTCRIPDENGIIQCLFVGVYLPSLISKQHVINISYALICCMYCLSSSQDNISRRRYKYNLHFELYLCWISSIECHVDEGW